MGQPFTEIDPLNVGAARNARHRSENAIELRLEERLLGQETAGYAMDFRSSFGSSGVRQLMLSGFLNCDCLGRRRCITRTGSRSSSWHTKSRVGGAGPPAWAG